MYLIGKERIGNLTPNEILYRTSFGGFTFLPFFKMNNSLVSFPTEEAANNWLNNNFIKIQFLCARDDIKPLIFYRKDE